MAQRHQESTNREPPDDLFESAFNDMSGEDFEKIVPVSSEKQRLAEKRRRLEQRLEEKRLREELGYYDLELDQF